MVYCKKYNRLVFTNDSAKINSAERCGPFIKITKAEYGHLKNQKYE